MNYFFLRNTYYFLILILVIYALPSIIFVKNIVHPVLNTFIIGIPLISIIAVTVGILGFIAYKYKRIG